MKRKAERKPRYDFHFFYPVYSGIQYQCIAPQPAKNLNSFKLYVKHHSNLKNGLHYETPAAIFLIRIKQTT